MQRYADVVENDESQWSDDPGIAYHFPKRCREYLAAGTKLLYYKGQLVNQAYAQTPLSPLPHYFGIADAGGNYLDKKSKRVHIELPTA